MSRLRLIATSNCFRHPCKTLISVWADCYAVNCHTVAALHSFTHLTWLRFESSGSLVESKWCHYVMIEADSQLKLLPSSILDIKKCLSKLICWPFAYSSSILQLYPPYLAQIWGFWVTCGWLKLPRKVSYKCTFGMPDQGQTLDAWESQTTESALRWQMCHIAPRHILELTLEVILEVILEHVLRIKIMIT
jgi:hypothetical protein